MAADRIWTEEDVRDILTNPFHSLGPTPTVPREQFIAAAERLIAAHGLAFYLNHVLDHVERELVVAH
jgi:hypothetical protein